MQPDFVGRFGRLLLVGAGMLLLCGGCRAGEPAAAPESRPIAQATRSAAAVPDLSAGPPRRATPLVEDRLYQEAAQGDPLDLHRLAVRDGAGRLLDAVYVGGTIGLTALSALPCAEDAELALGEVCSLLPRLPRTQLEPALRAVHGMAARPPAPQERLAVEGARRCEPVLSELAAAGDLPAPLHDLAVSAQVLLKEQLAR
jgi:hypothetical protein